MTTLPDWLATPCDRWADPLLLDHLRQVRKPWHRLVSRVVCEFVRRVNPVGSLVEIGAGDGQLRDWLPAELREQVTHTEPSEPFVDRLKSRFPNANVLRADAKTLPFESNSVDAILGLCVFDSLPDLRGAGEEFHRVLRPNGMVLHFLDLATNPDCLFPEVIACGELPLTNFAQDGNLLAVLSDEQKALLPATGEFDEVLAVDWQAFTQLTSLLEAARHPLLEQLGPYRRPDPQRLAQDYMSITADGARLSTFNRALLSVFLTAKSMGRDLPIRSISTRDHLRAKLQHAFAELSGFKIIHSGPIWTSESDASIPAGTAMLLRHAGQTRSLKQLVSLPGMEIEEGEHKPRPHSRLEPLRATSVEVFMAERVPPNE